MGNDIINTVPCRFCKWYSESEDYSTGWKDGDCTKNGEFLYEGARPCGQFVPILSSVGLYTELANESG